MTLETLQQGEYKVELEVFEGPLDLLLYLIRRDELDIYDIPIERITTQYMEYLGVMRMLDLGIAGEFLVMAATLLMIKSRMLLPVEQRRSDSEDGAEEWIDPRLDLVRQLIEYKKFKDAAAQLQVREALQSEIFSYGGDDPASEQEDGAQMLADIGLFDLLTAFQEVLLRVPAEPFGYIEPILWSVPDKMEAIIALTRQRREVAFSRLFRPESLRSEVIVTFLALLELLRLRQIALRQQAAFHEIIITGVSDDASDGALPPPVIGGGAHVES
ncbi:MAG: chromosome segregation protein ScpA [Lentisphaerae bacterium]|nr:chromosome segregation protein ScpA [Lentisphaerota bacterium]